MIPTNERMRGICIGGPQAGEWAEHYGPSFRSRPVHAVAQVGDEVPASIMDTSITYTLRRFRATEREFVFWVPIEMSDAQAMEMLTLSYIHNETRRMRSRP